MKHFYNIYRTQVLLTLCLVFTIVSTAQNIQFTFENALKTNDGSTDFYEADIMIAAIDGQSGFKLGSGQIYFNYNTAAFGEDIYANNRVEVTYPNAEGYICGQYVDLAPASIYGNFIVNDNTTSRFSWSFSQTFSSLTFAANNVTAIPTKLCHIKIEYVDVNQEAMVEFENDNNVLDQSTDQFFTACGSEDNGGGAIDAFDTADCTDYGGTQFVGAIFDNTGAVLSIEENTLVINQIKMYPNPTTDVFFIQGLQEEVEVTIHDLNGRLILRKENYQDLQEIVIDHLNAGTYLIRVQGTKTNSMQKLIKH